MPLAGTFFVQPRCQVSPALTFTQRTWQPNETVTYNFVWNQVNDNGLPVQPGTYRIFGYMDNAETVPEGMATVHLTP